VPAHTASVPAWHADNGKLHAGSVVQRGLRAHGTRKRTLTSAYPVLSVTAVLCHSGRTDLRLISLRKAIARQGFFLQVFWDVHFFPLQMSIKVLPWMCCHILLTWPIYMHLLVANILFILPHNSEQFPTSIDVAPFLYSEQWT